MTISTVRAAGLSVFAALPVLLLASSAQAALVISAGATQNVSCSSGVCSATAADAVLNVGDVTTMLASAPLTIQSGSQAQDIQVDAPFSWTSSNALTLDSYRAVTVDKPVSDAGPAALTITTNDGGTGGTLFFGTKGSVGFLSTAIALTIDGRLYKLEANLKDLAFDIARRPAGSFAFANAYDASADGLYLLSPITTTLRGNFTGLGNTISKLTIADGGASENVGLFAVLDAKAHVSGVRLKGEVVRGPGANSNVGGLAGINYGVIDNVSVDGTATGSSASVGLLVSLNEGSISNSASTGAVHGDIAGGVVGYGEGNIVASHSSAKITGNTAGGLYGGGESSPATISLSSASGDVTASRTAGGLAGVNASINTSFATGSVTGSNKQASYMAAGGLIGQGSACPCQATKITDSYATGAIAPKSGDIDTDYAGGLIGLANVILTTSYSIGPPSNKRGANVGGALGYQEKEYGGRAQDTYWDKDTARTKKGVGSGPKKGVIGLTDAELKSGLPAGFDPNVWAEDPNINNGYPYLIANPPVK